MVSSLHLAQASLNFQRSTEEIAEDFAVSYQLNNTEKFQIRREMRKMRLAKKAWTLKMRSHFPMGSQSEDSRQRFLNYFDRETQKIASRDSDSDDTLDLSTEVDAP